MREIITLRVLFAGLLNKENFVKFAEFILNFLSSFYISFALFYLFIFVVFTNLVIIVAIEKHAFCPHCFKLKT